MGSLKEVGDFLRDAKNIVKDVGFKVNDMKGLSIAKQSSASTLQFPVITSKSINIDTASNIVKALERQYAVFVQLTIQLNPVINWDKDDIGSFVNKIHQNNPTPVDVIESCINVYSDEALGLRMIMSLNEGCNAQVLRSNKSQLIVIEDHLNQTKLNDIYKPTQITLEQANASLDYFMLTEAKEKPKATDTKKGDKPRTSITNDEPVTGHNNGGNKHRELNILKGESEKREREAEKAKLRLDIDKANAEYRSKAVVKLSDTDVKKCNELVPTTLSVTLQQIKGDNMGGNITFVLGIKGIMHPVTSEEMVSNMLDGYKDGNKFFNFLRWTSGEISFLKDLVFNVDGIKEDVIKKHNKGSHWWTTLKRNKTLARIKNLYGKNRILPNATIVCSMEEVMEIKDTYNVDLMDPKHIKRIMDRYFLLGFVIVDESQEICYFLFDGENNYTTLSFSGLERENNSKNDFKDIYKMINSGRL